MRLPAERTNGLQDLGGILLLEQVDSQEAVMRGHVQRRQLASSQKVADVFHLHEGHCAGPELDGSGLALHCQIDQLAQRNTIFERIEQVAWWQ